MNIEAAKHRTRLILGCLTLFQKNSMFARRRMLNKMDSVGYMLSNALGPDAVRFAEEQVVYKEIRSEVADLKVRTIEFLLQTFKLSRYL